MKASEITPDVAEGRKVTIHNTVLDIVKWLGQTPVGCEFVWFLTSNGYCFYYPEEEVVFV